MCGDGGRPGTGRRSDEELPMRDKVGPKEVVIDDGGAARPLPGAELPNVPLRDPSAPPAPRRAMASVYANDFGDKDVMGASEARGDEGLLNERRGGSVEGEADSVGDAVSTEEPWRFTTNASFGPS